MGSFCGVLNGDLFDLCLKRVILAAVLGVTVCGKGGRTETSLRVIAVIQGRQDGRQD